jgi:hypothetical protein
MLIRGQFSVVRHLIIWKHVVDVRLLYVIFPEKSSNLQKAAIPLGSSSNEKKTPKKPMISGFLGVSMLLYLTSASAMFHST